MTTTLNAAGLTADQETYDRLDALAYADPQQLRDITWALIQTLAHTREEARIAHAAAVEAGRSVWRHRRGEDKALDGQRHLTDELTQERRQWLPAKIRDRLTLGNLRRARGRLARHTPGEGRVPSNVVVSTLGNQPGPLALTTTPHEPGVDAATTVANDAPVRTGAPAQEDDTVTLPLLSAGGAA